MILIYYRKFNGVILLVNDYIKDTLKKSASAPIKS